MMIQLTAILMSLMLGYYCYRLPLSNALIDKLLHTSIFLILFVMGYNVGADASHLLQQLLSMAKICSIFTIMLLLFNVLAIFICFRQRHRCFHLSKDRPRINFSVSQQLLTSTKYLLFIIAAMFLGEIMQLPLLHLNIIISLILMLLLFIIGIQLRRQELVLHALLMNRTGLFVAAITIISSAIAGAISSWILSLPLKIGLVLASGFGWYSLSGVLSGQLINHKVGTIAFFIDFTREVIAIILLPWLARLHPFSAIGYCGATALDFSLPAIKINLGEQAMPVAINSGMILTLLVPILIPLLAKI